MSLKEIHTKIVNKWIKIEGLNEELKNILYDFDGDNLIGYVYIDHTAGITLDIIKLFDLENEKFIFKESPSDRETRIISRLSGIINAQKVTVLDNEFINEYNLKTPEYLSIYERNDLEEFRLENKFHEFRAEGYPDDIQILLLPDTTYQPELVWGRVEKYKNDILTCSILNQPNQDLGIHINDLVDAAIEILGGNKYIVHKIKLTSASNNKSKKSWWKFW